MKSEPHNVTVRCSVGIRMATNKSVGFSNAPQETATDCGHVGLQAIMSTVGLFANKYITLNHEWNITRNYAVRMRKTLKHQRVHYIRMPPFEIEAWIGSRELTRKAKNLQHGGKKQKHRRTHGRKNCRQETFRNYRYIKNTQRRKIARKQLTQTRNHEDICEYGRYANMMRIIVEPL